MSTSRIRRGWRQKNINLSPSDTPISSCVNGIRIDDHLPNTNPHERREEKEEANLSAAKH